MIIDVPSGQSKTVCFTVTPELPQGGVAQEWKLVCTSENPSVHTDEMEIWFALSSPPSLRLSELAILQFTIDPEAQTHEHAWRFFEPGFVFSASQPDVKDCFSIAVSNNGMEITANVRCLDDVGEQFKFSFLALCTENSSGISTIYASADPQGRIGRRN